MVLRRVWSRLDRAAIVGLVGLAASIVVTTATPADAARRKFRGGGYNPPYAAMVVDVKTGRTLHAENEDAPRIPASITKVMTLYLLFEQLERGRVRLDTEMEVSSYAARQPPTKLGLRAGATIAVEDAIKSLVTLSANDISVVIAEHIAGSEDAFAEMMTRKARSLGMKSTTFRNPHGLPASPPNITTARDLTVLARAIQERFPRYYSYFQTRTFQYGSRRIGNHNRLLGRVEGVDGIKTGFTRASGFNLMTSAKTDDRHIVAIVLGGRSGASRDAAMTRLVELNLPRAFAGARTAPMIADADRNRPVAFADASRGRTIDPSSVDTTAAVPLPPVRQPIEVAAMRPVVASAVGVSTTTPTSGSARFSRGSTSDIPPETQAYAALARPQAISPLQIVPVAEPAPAAAPTAKIEARLPPPEAFVPAAPRAPEPPARVEARAETPARAEPAEARRELPKPSSVSPWVIQLGAMDEESKALEILDEARAKNSRLLGRAAPFTEKVVRDGTTLYRARFTGFQEADSANQACRTLKRSGFNCFATRS